LKVNVKGKSLDRLEQELFYLVAQAPFRATTVRDGIWPEFPGTSWPSISHLWIVPVIVDWRFAD
jgi:hypothetical protein